MLHDLILGGASAAANSGGFVPIPRLHSARRARRRVLRGRPVSLDRLVDRWRLPPESVKVVARTGSSVLQTQVLAPINLGTAFPTVHFTHPPLVSGPGDRSMWLQLDGPAGSHYRSADEPGLMLIGMRAKWQYPPTPTSDQGGGQPYESPLWGTPDRGMAPRERTRPGRRRAPPTELQTAKPQRPGCRPCRADWPQSGFSSRDVQQ